VNGDKVIRAAMAAVVVAVAGFAAVVSYSHIYGLGRAHGQVGAAARLLPLSVDGLIVAASLVLLHEARNGRGAPGLARVMLWLGIAATVGANVAFGVRFGVLGAVISAWPAVAFIGAVEMAMTLVRRARAPQRAEDAPDRSVVPVCAGAAGGAGGRARGGRGGVRDVGGGGRAAEPAGDGRPVRHLPPPGQPAHRPGRRPDAGRGGGGRVNRYGAMARRHWERWLPGQYAAVEDPGGFFAALGEEAARQVDDLAEQLAGDGGPGEGYLERAGRLAAGAQAVW
jgi:Protein of unknown function (DUF2637)